jgi:hypothetical protein
MFFVKKEELIDKYQEIGASNLTFALSISQKIDTPINLNNILKYIEF